MEEKVQKPYGRLKVMVAVSDSPESQAALCWALENLVCKEDWLLIYHTVKTPDLIHTAMGKVPFIGASPAMQKAHLMVANADANKLLAGFEAYCTSMKIFPFTEVGRCENRKEDIVEKVMEEGITHLVMGTRKKSRFAFKSWGPRRSLTSRICQEVTCHVTLVDKDKRSTFHTRVPTFKTGDAQMQHRSVSLSSEALAILKESGLRALSSDVTAATEPPIAPKPETRKRNVRPNNRYATPPPTRQSFSTFAPPPGALNLTTPPKPPLRHSLSALKQDPVTGPARLQSDGLSRQNSDADDIKRVLDMGEEPSKERDFVPQMGNGKARYAPRNRSAERLKSARHFYSSPARGGNESVFMSEGSEDEAEWRDYSFSARYRAKGSNEQNLHSKRPATVAPASEIKPPTSRQVSFRETGVGAELPTSPEVTVKKAMNTASVKRRFFSSPSRSGKVTQSDFLGSPTRDSSPDKSAKKSLRYGSPSKWLASLALAHIKPPASTESDVARLRKSQETMRKSQDDVISQLWQQVEKLKEIGVLRDQEIVEVANRAQRAEREAEERDRALAEQARELADLKANQLVMQMAALSASPDRYDCEDTNGPKDWPSFAGTGLWTISEG